jgi:SAM-dependent methyltransferase
MKCRHCHAPLERIFVDLGSAPPSNAYLTERGLHGPEKWFPLRVLVCERCWLVQTEDFAGASDLFDADYAYFSSYSDSWLRHSAAYVDAVCERFALGGASRVVEIAANDGYLLQYVRARGIPCLGVEPTASTAAAARAKGIEIVEEFFGLRLAEELAAQGLTADLMVANNVLAHVPDINDFVAGFARLLEPDGVATFEFPHLCTLVADGLFDTIYHEHFSYLSLTSATNVFAANGLSVFDVEQLPTHGGSLRLFAQRSDTGARPRTIAVERLLERETADGVGAAAYYFGFQRRVEAVKRDFVTFLLAAQARGEAVAAYGAAAKGNTLMNYAGVRPDLVRFVVDRNPAKQGKFMPGSRIPIVAEDAIRRLQPAFVLILPWNLKAEIIDNLAYVREWGGQFAVALPGLQVIP